MMPNISQIIQELQFKGFDIQPIHDNKYVIRASPDLGLPNGNWFDDIELDEIDVQDLYQSNL